jgi:hypothetical protein
LDKKIKSEESCRHEKLKSAEPRSKPIYVNFHQEDFNVQTAIRNAGLNSVNKSMVNQMKLYLMGSGLLLKSSSDGKYL